MSRGETVTSTLGADELDGRLCQFVGNQLRAPAYQRARRRLFLVIWEQHNHIDNTLDSDLFPDSEDEKVDT